jgi:hypothetical protein
VGWALLAIQAAGVGLYSLRYLLPGMPLAIDIPNFRVRQHWLIAHATFSSIALLAGPWQFVEKLRRRWLPAHRWTGRVCCLAVLAGWIASLPIAAHANTGPVASAGFLMLGLLWILSTAAAYLRIRQRRVEAHREWMVRSYALTAAAITLRSCLPMLLVSGVPYNTSYRIVAWACWIPNLLFAEWLVRRNRDVPVSVVAYRTA